MQIFRKRKEAFQYKSGFNSKLFAHETMHIYKEFRDFLFSNFPLKSIEVGTTSAHVFSFVHECPSISRCRECSGKI